MGIENWKNDNERGKAELLAENPTNCSPLNYKFHTD